MINVSESKSSSMAQLIKNEAGIASFLKEGDLVEVKLLQKNPKAAFFDIEKFGTGIVYGRELINAKDILRDLKKGDTVSAKIAELENEDGFIELSLVNAQDQKNWESLRGLKESGEIITVKIKGANSGGLIASVSEVKAFMPVSQLSSEHYPRIEKGDSSKILSELKKFVGQDLKVKVIDVNPRTNKLIISEKEAVGENMKELLSKYAIGDIIDGIVSGVADFGAFVRFVDNPAVEGLVHISELDYKLIENPKEVVKVDDAIKAKIIEIKDDKVFLSLKALKPNPWDKASEFFKDGQEVSGTAYKINPFGAYIDLGDDLYGMIHISEFGSLEEMKKQLEQGKKYDFIIESVKPEEKRITLKMKSENKE